MGHVPRGCRLRRPGRAVPECDKDSISAKPSKRSNSLPLVGAQVLDGIAAEVLLNLAL